MSEISENCDGGQKKSIELGQKLVLTLCEFHEGGYRNDVVKSIDTLSGKSSELTMFHNAVSSFDNCESVLLQVLISQPSFLNTAVVVILIVCDGDVDDLVSSLQSFTD